MARRTRARYYKVYERARSSPAHVTSLRQPRPLSRVLLVITTALTLAIAAPWRYAGHPHWATVEWIPFATPLRPMDIVANLLLFAPVGCVSAVTFDRRPVLAASLVALVLSSGIEFVQVFSHARFPSGTDLACNVLGATLAARAIATSRRT